MKSFKSFISLCEQSIDYIVHGEPSGEHYRIMQTSHDILPVDSNQSLVSAPPSNTSDETRAELMELQDRLELEKSNKEIFEKWDANILTPFIDYLDKNNLKYNRELLENILNAATNVILNQKYIFNRPRPRVLAKELVVSMSPLTSSTADTPAYPSGHSGQSRILALYLSERHTDHSQGFLELAEECGLSRLNGGVHYPSDHEAGVEIGNILYESMEK
jgi:acid phosphatase (class A)